MTNTATAPAPAMDVNNNQQGVKLNGHKVPFNFPFNNCDPVPQTPKVLHSILRRLVPSCGGVHNIIVNLDNFPQDKATFDFKFNTTVSNQRQRHILLVLEVRSVKTLYALKQIVWQ